MKIFKKFISLILCFSIIVTIFPNFSNAEVKRANWEEKEEEDNYWDLPSKTKFVRGQNGAGLLGLKVPNVDFLGTYNKYNKNNQMVEVVRFAFKKQQNDRTAWNKFVVKLDKKLYDMVNWTENENWDNDDKLCATGFYVNARRDRKHDALTYTKVKPFLNLKKEDVGSDRAKGIDLFHAGANFNGITGGFEIPFQFELKPGYSIKNCKEDLLIQMRLFNDDYSEIYTRTEYQEKILSSIPYNNYTFTTIIPTTKDFKKNLSIYMDNHNSVFRSTDIYINYNPKKGYIDVVHKQNKGPSGPIFYDDPYAFYQAFDKSFLDILKERNGSIGAIYLANIFDVPYYNDIFNDDGTVKKDTKHAVPFGINDINKANSENNLDKNVCAILASTKKDWKDEKTIGLKNILTQNNMTECIINAASTPNRGNSTIVRYYVDTEKVSKGFDKLSLNSYSFYSAFIVKTNEDKKNLEFEHEILENVEIPRGVSIKFKFNNREKRNVRIVIGDKQYRLPFKDSIEGRRGEFVWKFPFSMALKKGDTIKVYTNKTRNDPTLQIIGLEEKDITLTKKDKNIPRILDFSEALSGGTIVKSQYTPIVNEIFTDSNNITGFSKYERAEVSIGLYNKNIQSILASNKIEEIQDLKDEKKQKQKGYLYDTLKPDILENKEQIEKYEKFDITNLEKDAPVTVYNRYILKGFGNSDYVTEQVQAKVIFHLGDYTSNYDGGEFLERIVPLNKEYLYKREISEDLQKIVYTKNENYKPNGFNEKNSKVVKDHEKVSVLQTIGSKEVKREFINYLNHHDEAYKITSNDNEEKKRAIDNLSKRQFPHYVEINVPKGLKILGWTTKKLEGSMEDVASKFRKLKKDGKIIRSLEDWKKSDNGEDFVFDKESVVDKKRDVYAVYGRISLIFHKDLDESKDTPKIISIDKDDIKEITKDEFDSVTGATKVDSNKKNEGKKEEKKEETLEKRIAIIKDIPDVPYLGKIESENKLFKDFKKEKHTFIGWYVKTTKDDDVKKGIETFLAGNNNKRLNYTMNHKKFKDTESLGYIKNHKLDSYLPNGFKFLIKPPDFVVDGKKLSTIEDIMDYVGDIHLYPIYRPYFDVNVTARYKKGIEKITGLNGFSNTLTEDELFRKYEKNEKINLYEAGRYEDFKEDKPTKELNIGLLTRTAVTPYTDPTVAASAKYSAILGLDSEGRTLQKWTDENKKVSWNVPGFDKYGMRKSYVSVVVTEDKKEAYNNFGIKDFTEETWKTLDLTTYLKLSGKSKDKHSPRNLYEVNDSKEIDRDSYGMPLSKTQNFSFKENEEIHSFTSATSRASVVKTGRRFNDETEGKERNLQEVSGYNIVMTNYKDSIPKPYFDMIVDGDKEAFLQFPDKNHASYEYEEIEKITFKLQKGLGKDLTDEDKKEITFNVTFDEDKKTYTFKNTKNTNYSLEYDKENKKVILKGLDFTGRGGQNISASYIKKSGNLELKSSTTEPIIPKKISKRITEIYQLPKENEEDKDVKIEFKIPVEVLDKVEVGSKFIAQKWVEDEKDKEKGKWVDVGEKVLEEKDRKNDTFEGNAYKITLKETKDSKKISHMDIIRIKSLQKNETTFKRDNFYTEDEKTLGCEVGFSKPNYSTFNIEKGDTKELQEKRDKKYNVSTSNLILNHEYVILDLEAPKGEVKRVDELFRRFVNVEGKIFEKPYGKTILKVGDGISSKEIEIDNFIKKVIENKENYLFKEIDVYDWIKNIPKMTLDVRDFFNNKDTLEVKENKTKAVSLSIFDLRNRRKSVTFVLKNTTETKTFNIKATIFRDGKVLEEKTFKVSSTTKGDFDNRFKNGDILHIEGKFEGEDTFYLNPMDIKVN